MSVSVPQRWDRKQLSARGSRHGKRAAGAHCVPTERRSGPSQRANTLSPGLSGPEWHHAALPQLKKRRGGAPYPSLLMCYRCCESSAAQQGLPLARIVQNRINSPSKHLLRPCPTDGRLPDIWILFHAETLMPREPPAMQGM